MNRHSNGWQHSKMWIVSWGIFLIVATVIQRSVAQVIQWAPVGDNTINMLLIEKQGDKAKQYIGKLKGSISVDANQRVVQMDGTIKSLETDDGKIIPIKKAEVKDGTIALTTDDGAVYTIYDLSSNLRGSIRLTETPVAPGATPATAATSHPGMETFKSGDTAFVRVKEYTALAGDPTVHDGLGGEGYAIKNLNPGFQAVLSTPDPKSVTFSFGDKVTLVEKKDGIPALWVVSKDQAKAELPEYLLAAQKDEIDFLKEKNRVPDSMTLVYMDPKNLLTKVWGIYSMDGNVVLESHGLALMDHPEGSSPFAFRGNAVVFDRSFLDTGLALGKPVVFDAEKNPFSLSPSCIYYCGSDGDKPAFESIELKDAHPSK